MPFFTSPAVAEIYLGYTLEFMSKGGLTLGYRMNQQNSIELHLNGTPAALSTGVFYKRYGSPNARGYMLIGYSAVTWWSHYLEEPTPTYHGLNFGGGYEFGSDDSLWSYPLEIGGGPGYSFSEDAFLPQFFVGFGALYGIDRRQ